MCTWSFINMYMLFVWIWVYGDREWKEMNQHTVSSNVAWMLKLFWFLFSSLTFFPDFQIIYHEYFIHLHLEKVNSSAVFVPNDLLTRCHTCACNLLWLMEWEQKCQVPLLRRTSWSVYVVPLCFHSHRP